MGLPIHLGTHRSHIPRICSPSFTPRDIWVRSNLGTEAGLLGIGSIQKRQNRCHPVFLWWTPHTWFAFGRVGHSWQDPNWVPNIHDYIPILSAMRLTRRVRHDENPGDWRGRPHQVPIPMANLWNGHAMACKDINTQYHQSIGICKSTGVCKDTNTHGHEDSVSVGCKSSSMERSATSDLQQATGPFPHE